MKLALINKLDKTLFIVGHENATPKIVERALKELQLESVGSLNEGFITKATKVLFNNLVETTTTPDCWEAKQLFRTSIKNGRILSNVVYMLKTGNIVHNVFK